MESYSEQRWQVLESLDPEAEDYEACLLEAARCFRSFDRALDPFLVAHGYEGAPEDTEAKLAFLRARYRAAGIAPPREMERWFKEHREIERKTAFTLCFAFGLDAEETDAFFRNVFGRERSFDHHTVEEAVYYFCIRNGRPYREAQALIARIPPVPREPIPEADILYTGTILKELRSMSDPEVLVAYLTNNISAFAENNTTATLLIGRLWQALAGENGLLLREPIPCIPKQTRCRAEKGLNAMDAWLAMLDLEKESVARLSADKRTIRPLLKQLLPAIEESFPERQGIERILEGTHMGYERVRKWLVLLSFMRFWLKLAVERGDYAARPGDMARCLDGMDSYLTDAGYMPLYIGNPYDWIFLYASYGDQPLPEFRELWGILMAEMSERSPE